MRNECEVCKVEVYLQQLGNYYRIRHYEGKGENGKGKFFYHQQTKDYAESKLRELKQNLSIRKESNTVAIEQKGQCTIDLTDQNTITNIEPKQAHNGSNTENKGGCRLVWFRTLAFQANDPGFKSRRPHQNSIRKLV
jgi:hypothetical protein